MVELKSEWKALKDDKDNLYEVKVNTLMQDIVTVYKIEFDNFILRNLSLTQLLELKNKIDKELNSRGK